MVGDEGFATSATGLRYMRTRIKLAAGNVAPIPMHAQSIIDARACSAC